MTAGLILLNNCFSFRVPVWVLQLRNSTCWLAEWRKKKAVYPNEHLRNGTLQFPQDPLRVTEPKHLRETTRSLSTWAAWLFYPTTKWAKKKKKYKNITNTKQLSTIQVGYRCVSCETVELHSLWRYCNWTGRYGSGGLSHCEPKCSLTLVSATVEIFLLKFFAHIWMPLWAEVSISWLLWYYNFPSVQISAHGLRILQLPTYNTVSLCFNRVYMLEIHTLSGCVCVC